MSNETIKKVLEQFNLEANDNVVELYDTAVCRLLNESECFIEDIVAEGFDRDALERILEIEMDNE